MNVVVIGSGKLGQRHLRMWSKIKEVNIVGVIARNQQRLKTVAEKFSTNAYLNIAEAIQASHVDIIDICTPTHTHVDLIKEAAQAKKHIICEKPLALGKAEAKKAIRACEENNVQLFVGHTLRFFPKYQEARHLIKEGLIGKPGMIRLERGATRPLTSWYSDYEKSGGLFLDLGIHDLDWLLWTLGDVQEVMAQEISNAVGQLTYGLASIRMKSGAIATIKLSWEEKEFYSRFEVAGDQGTLTFDSRINEAFYLNVYEAIDEKGIKKELHELTVEQTQDPFHHQLEHFLNCIKGRETPIITPQEAFKAVALGEAILQSATRRKTVLL